MVDNMYTLTQGMKDVLDANTDQLEANTDELESLLTDVKNLLTDNTTWWEATGGGENIIAADNNDFETDMFKGAIAEIIIDDVSYLRTVISNTAKTITIAPLPGSAATATLYSGLGNDILITVNLAGAFGNNYTVGVIDGVGISVPLSAELIEDRIVVTLPTDVNGDPTGAATATDVANAIDGLAGNTFSAQMIGMGGVATVTVEDVQFMGGIDQVWPNAQDKFRILPQIKPAEDTDASVSTKGFDIISDAAQHIGNYSVIVFLVDTVISAIQTEASCPITGSFADITFTPSSMALYGLFTSITLTSGTIIAYKR
jgi:hypothetical protein